MNKGNYFTDHNKQFVVSNAKQLTRKEEVAMEEHPLQREFIDVLKSKGLFDEFKEKIKTSCGVDINAYCNLFAPDYLDRDWETHQ